MERSEAYARRRARWLAKDAIRHGKLHRGPCERAGRDCSGPIEAHHDDYSRPLDVRWLCRHHHRKEDGPKFARFGNRNGQRYANLQATVKPAKALRPPKPCTSKWGPRLLPRTPAKRPRTVNIDRQRNDNGPENRGRSGELSA